MNIDQAKQIALPSFLSRLGYEPASNRKGQLWYLSPLRHETEPSFKVNPAINAWYDFAEGKGGDIIDFVKQYQRVSTVADALTCIRHIESSDPLPKQEPLPLEKRSQDPAIKLDHIGPVKSKALLAYLQRRGISLPLAASRVQEAHYHCGNKSYYGLAFANDSGAYEIRNPMWKGSIGTKDITTIKGETTDRVAVFEGFFDYLTAVTMHRGALDETVIVLNSVAFRDRALAKLKQWGSKHVQLYRDNDTAGVALLDFFRGELSGAEIHDMSTLYAGHEDLNAWHVHQQAVCAIA